MHSGKINALQTEESKRHFSKTILIVIFLWTQVHPREQSQDPSYSFFT